MTNLIELGTVSKVDLNLPTVPGIALKLLEIFEKDPPDLKKAGEIISLDAPLSAKLLKAVNSPLYAGANRISTVSQAIPLLGADAVKHLALSFSLTPNFRPQNGPANTYSQFWKDSLVGAVAARAISAKLITEFSDEAFFCGLLQNIGSLILAESFPEEYEMIMGKICPAPVSIVHAESKIFGLDHTVVGEYAVQKWGLPDLFTAPIRFHHQPEAFSGIARGRSMAQILYLASLFIDAFSADDPQPQFEKIDRFQDGCGYAEVIDPVEIIRQISAEVNSLLPIYDIEVDGGEHNRIIESSKQELAGLLGDQMVQVKKQANAIEQLKQQSSIDGLTKLYNQTNFVRTLKNEIERANRHSTPLSLVMADIDDFKVVNDFHGHLAGDYVLKTIAHRLNDALRGSDYLARYGGEEFAAILPLTTLPEAIQVTERLRDTVREKPVVYKGKTLSVTMSFGIASLKLNQRIELDGFIHMADEALYQAKNNGKDQCCIYERAKADQTRAIVLVVDDESVVLETLSKMLERLGFGVITAKDGGEALALFGTHENKIETVILDVMMPGISSTEVFTRLKRADSDVRVFLSSGYTVDQIERNLMAQCEGFLAKPFTIDDLSAKLGVSVPSKRTVFRHTSDGGSHPNSLN